jgi:hypothetical protein
MAFSTQTFRGRVTVEGATTLKIYNVVSPVTPNTEFSQALNNGVKKLIIRTRGNGNLQVCFESGNSNIEFFTIPCGATYSEDNLNLNGVTLYLQTNKASEVIEILEWS